MSQNTEQALDPEFKPMQIGVKETLHKLEQALSKLKQTDYTIFPTEEGGVKLYWSKRKDMLSIEIEPDTFTIYTHSVNLEEKTYKENYLKTVELEQLKTIF